MPTPRPHPAHFGQPHLAQALAGQIRAHFERGTGAGLPINPVEQALVVGVMGEWGSGKSMLLHDIGQAFNVTEPLAVQTTETTPKVVITIPFNAWQFEKEPHLVVPLMQCVQQAVLHYVKQRQLLEAVEAEDAKQGAEKTQSKTLWQSLLGFGGFFTRSAAAFASGFEATVELPLSALQGLAGLPGWLTAATAVGKGDGGKISLKINPKSMVDIWRGDKKKPAAEDKTPHTQAAHSELAQKFGETSIYYNFSHTLKTEIEELEKSQDINLSLLFLIDDLDRCLPEKALEMLESIKLFFDIPDCVFVLGVDDEVVSRGVQHRYRDYLQRGRAPAQTSVQNPAQKPEPPDTDAPDGQSGYPTYPEAELNDLALPITGAEYLEKMVHIPVRLAAPNRTEAQQFLISHAPDLFDENAISKKFQAQVNTINTRRESTGTPGENDEDNTVKSGKDTRAAKKESDEASIQQAQQAELEQLYQLAEDSLDLISHAVPPVPRKLQRTVALYRLQLDTFAQGNKRLSLSERLQLLRLCIWQLFAPDLYRYCRRDPNRFVYVANWYYHHDRAELVQLQEPSNPSTYYKNSDATQLRQGSQRLRRMVAQSSLQRSEFDLRKLFLAYDTDHAAAPTASPAGSANSSANEKQVPLWTAEKFRSELLPLLEPNQSTTEIPRTRPPLRATAEAAKMAAKTAEKARTSEPRTRLNPQDALFARTRVAIGQVADPQALLRKLFTDDLLAWDSAFNQELQGGALPTAVVERITDHPEYEQYRAKPAWREAVIAKLSPADQLALGKPLTPLLGPEPSAPPTRGLHSAIVAQLGHTDGVRACAFSPDGAQVLTASDDRSAKLWDAASGKVLRSFEGHTDWVSGCAFSPNGTQVLTASDDGSAKLWNAASGKVVSSFEGHRGWFTACAFSPDGAQVLTASDDGSAKLWDAASGKVLRSFEGHKGGITACAFSKDGAQVLTASDDGSAKLWDAASSKVVRSFEGHNDWVRACAFSPDGAQVLTASDDRSAKLWDAASGKVLRSFEGHEGWVSACAFSPDGAQVLTASGDRSAKLWDAASGKVLRSFKGHEGGVYACAFSPDGLKVLTASNDGSAKLWDAASGRLIRTFSAVNMTAPQKAQTGTVCAYLSWTDANDQPSIGSNLPVLSENSAPTFELNLSDEHDQVFSADEVLKLAENQPSHWQILLSNSPLPTGMVWQEQPESPSTRATLTWTFAEGLLLWGDEDSQALMRLWLECLEAKGSGDAIDAAEAQPLDA